ncbi:zinc finger (c3hc4 ring finger) domain-containing protein [Cyclospora cayetanensis]|uniref:Zinc finger (C3hc4 ring finger) domain-containing protein n=1 Tax=Cyclospora cayetanensis TaxID=88456 RepID=A0A1D3CUE3_9EIME|nr:zinc finger (c3hc4 ring finger) domain-containing protein [Cyclospora cayetanensis]
MSLLREGGREEASRRLSPPPPSLQLSPAAERERLRGRGEEAQAVSSLGREFFRQRETPQLHPARGSLTLVSGRNVSSPIFSRTAVAASALPHDVGGSNSGSSHGRRGLPIYGCLICGESRCACAAKGSRLPLELDLGPRLQFHSCITCAVSKEEATQTNPAKLLSCGHVVCA